MSGKYSLNEISQTLEPVFLEYGVKKAILFGSYAKGNATVRSDVDILVDSGLKGLAFFGLLDRIADALNIPVDLIDVTQLEKGSEIDREIIKTGVMIYEQ